MINNIKSGVANECYTALTNLSCHTFKFVFVLMIKLKFKNIYVILGLS